MSTVGVLASSEPCRYADQCNEEGACGNGCEDRAGRYMRHKPSDTCECHDCHVARTRGVTEPGHHTFPQETPPIPEEPQSPTTTGGEKE